MKLKLLPWALAIFLVSAGSGAVGDDQVLVWRDEVKLTRSDLDRLLETYVPVAEHADLRANEKKLRDFIAQAFAGKLLAAEAVARPLSEDERWQLDNARERQLSQLQVRHLVAQTMPKDFSAEAKEYYLAHPEQFTRPQAVRVEHILIGTGQRSDAEAAAKAADLLRQLQAAPAEFARFASEHSDDQSVARNKGDLGFIEPGKMVAEFEQAAFALKEPGAIAGPIKTQFGYHLIHLLERRPAETLAFEQVREKLEQDAQEKMRRDLVRREYERVGALPGIEVDQDAISRIANSARSE